MAYGREGEASKNRQAAQDKNAAVMGAATSVQRSVAKAQEAYANEGWDLADAVQSGTVKVASLKDDELPVEMRKMTLAEREKYVDGLVARRAELQRQINDLNEQRRDVRGSGDEGPCRGFDARAGDPPRREGAGRAEGLRARVTGE